MPKWKDMSNRDKDAWGAEHVMGWRWIVYSVDLGKTARIIKPPDEVGFHNHPEEFWDGITEMPVNTVHLDRFCPSTNASADCEILEKVQETWDSQESIKFEMQLEGLLGSHGSTQAMNYRKGYYLHAAFLAKNGE